MNDFEHLQSIFRLMHNQLVNEFFRNVEVPEVIEDIRNIPSKANLKKAGLIKDNDTASIMDMRLQLFKLIKGDEIHIFSNIDKISTHRRHKPKVCLYFIEDLEDVEEGYSPVDGQIGFRLMNPDSDNDISEATARVLGNRIKSIFGSNDGFLWHKGKDMVSYCDWDKGYQLQLLCRNLAEGERVITQVLEIQGHPFESDNLTYNVNSNPARRYPTIPDRKSILGSLQRMPRERPIATIRFSFATLTVRGMLNPLVLYSRTKQTRFALVE